MPLPFTVKRENHDLVRQPQELLIIVRTLMNALAGTTYRGHVPIGEGVESFLFDRGGQGILVLWDRGASAG